MKTILVFMAAMLGLLPSQSVVPGQISKPNAAHEELQQLAGIWQEESRVRDGAIVPGAQLSVMILDHAGTATTRLGDRDAGRYDVAVDPSPAPKSIDFTQTSETTVIGSPGDRRLGIYEIKGDNLRICLARAGALRPGRFDASVGSGLVLSTYTRRNR